MTAMAAIIKSDRVHVLADAAHCNLETGELMGVSSNIIPLGRLNAVFVASGPGKNAAATFGLVCAEWDHDDFDAFAADLPDMLALYKEHTGFFESDLLIAGFSNEWQRPAVICWHSRKEPYGGMEPGQLYVREEGVVSFGLPTLPMAEEFDLKKHGFAAFDDARRKKLDIRFGLGPEANMGYRIGGSLGHAEVRKGGIKSAWLRHWPDRVGKTIDPFNAAQLAMPLV